MKGIERAARALCELDNNFADVTFLDRPMWASYLPEVRTVVNALMRSEPPGIDPTAWRAALDAILFEGKDLRDIGWDQGTRRS